MPKRKTPGDQDPGISATVCIRRAVATCCELAEASTSKRARVSTANGPGGPWKICVAKVGGSFEVEVTAPGGRTTRHNTLIALNEYDWAQPSVAASAAEAASAALPSNEAAKQQQQQRSRHPRQLPGAERPLRRRCRHQRRHRRRRHHHSLPLRFRWPPQRQTLPSQALPWRQGLNAKRTCVVCASTDIVVAASSASAYRRHTGAAHWRLPRLAPDSMASQVLEAL